MNRSALAVALVIAQLAHSDCPRPASASALGVASAGDEKRLMSLSKLAGTEASHIGLWKLLSGSTFALLVVGQLAIAPLFDEKVRTDYFWGAGYSALGMASTLVGAPAVFENGPAFVTRAGAATDENRCAIIAEGEALLAKSAADEVLPTRWYLHALNVAVNVSLGAILGFGYQHWVNAIINTLVGIALSETVLFTKPHALIAAWNEYLHGSQPITLGLRVGASLNGGATLGLGGTF